jgi:hypothetical protein
LIFPNSGLKALLSSIGTNKALLLFLCSREYGGNNFMQQLSSENIVEILKSEHNLVRRNLKKVLAKNIVDQEVISQTASAALNHFNGEEKLVFPSLRVCLRPVGLPLPCLKSMGLQGN